MTPAPEVSDASHLDLDGRLLKLLVVLVEEGSITRAAERSDTTQSAVSHLLAKLRRIVGDPLFVKAGRGVVATARAVELAERARGLLEGMRAFACRDSFDPASFEGEFVIAANDLQRDLLLPALLRRLRVSAPRLQMRIIPSNVPTPDMLREERCQLVVTPRPPPAGDILQRRLFEDRYVCLYDAAVRSAPASREEYLEAEHLTVSYESRGPLDIDRELAERGLVRRFAAVVSNFSGIPPFLRGSPYLVTLPSLLGAELLRGFAQSPLPFACPRMPMYMVWHQRDHRNPAHCWIRAELAALGEAVAQRVEE
jgi:DNA-binding transcriptional LysR family regulator